MEVWPITKLLREVKVGSREWSWHDEYDDIFNNPALRPIALELADKLTLEPQIEPVLLGDDGRLWDGHKRVCVLLHIGEDKILVEYANEKARTLWSTETN